jgi:hypothetical protein
MVSVATRDQPGCPMRLAAAAQEDCFEVGRRGNDTGESKRASTAFPTIHLQVAGVTRSKNPTSVVRVFCKAHPLAADLPQHRLALPVASLRERPFEHGKRTCGLRAHS